MGITIKILMGPKAYNMLEDRLKTNKELGTQKSINAPQWLEKKDNGSVIIGWSNMEWSSYLKDMRAVVQVLNTLDKREYTSKEALPDYYYKCIRIDEDGSIDKTTNDWNEYYVKDFYTVTGFSM